MKQHRHPRMEDGGSNKWHYRIYCPLWPIILPTQQKLGKVILPKSSRITYITPSAVEITVSLLLTPRRSSVAFFTLTNPPALYPAGISLLPL